MEIDDALVEEQTDALYGAEETQETPSVGELREKQRQEAAEFPERMEKLAETVQEKAAEALREATGDDETESETAPKWSDADLRDLSTFQTWTQRYQAADAALRQADAKLTDQITKTMADHGASSFEELRRANPGVAAALAADVRKLQEHAQQIDAAGQHIAKAATTIETNLTQRQISAAQTKLFRDYPDLADEDVRSKFAGYVASSTGYSVEEIGNIQDPKVVRGLIKAFWKPFQNEHATSSKNLRIPKGKRRQAAPAARSRAMPSLVELARGAPLTKLGKQQKVVDKMYGRTAERKAPARRQTRDAASILYGSN
ncbi:MAG: hypothetical protein RIE74_02120 [Pseudomonadales bacterium]